VRAAAEADCVLELLPAMGDFVPTGAPLLRVEGGRYGLDGEQVVRLVRLERERSHVEDPAYGIRKLVDIAERGLAEPFQDPSTAVQAFDRIHDILRLIAVRKIPSGEHRDTRGELRLKTRSLQWDGYVLLGFEELCVAGAGSPQVSRRLRAALDDLKSLVSEARQLPLDRQIALLDAAIEAQFAEGEMVESARTPDPQGIGSATDIRLEPAQASGL
jgi:uncharacterized membrane protein